MKSLGRLEYSRTLYVSRMLEGSYYSSFQAQSRPRGHLLWKPSLITTSLPPPPQLTLGSLLCFHSTLCLPLIEYLSHFIIVECLPIYFSWGSRKEVPKCIQLCILLAYRRLLKKMFAEFNQIPWLVAFPRKRSFNSSSLSSSHPIL